MRYNPSNLLGRSFRRSKAILDCSIFQTVVVSLSLTLAPLAAVSTPLKASAEPTLVEGNYNNSSEDTNLKDSKSADQTLEPREEELRRKELELLKALDLKPSRVTERTSGSLVIAEIPAPKLAQPEKVRAQDSNSAPQGEQLKSLPVTQNADSTLLKELEHHPALEQPAKTVPIPTDINPAVRTYPSEGSPDGTTAKGVPSFYRIERSPGGEDTEPYPSRILTVPITELNGAATLRPAAINSSELAKIRPISAFLRTGPTPQDSSLLKVSKHSELRVDYRSGSWYRVRTENGVRGWVPGNVLLFEDNMAPGSTVRIGGVRPAEE
jgi:hypothetical protein